MSKLNMNVEDSVSPVVVIDETQIKQFQSLYYLFKGKRDTDIKLFDDYKQFSYCDIVDLNNKIYKKIELHEKVTAVTNVSVGLDNREIKTFGSWHEFVQTDWNISPRTKYVSVEWDFNIILPNQLHRVPQTHTLRLKMGNSIRPSEMIQMVFQDGEEYELEEIQSQMVCKIDFVNAQVCNELKAVVCEWYEALPRNSDEHRLIRFILKHLVKLQNVIELSFITAGIILSNFLFGFIRIKEPGMAPADPNLRLFFYLTAFIPVVYLFYRSGVLYADRVMKKTVARFSRNPMFEITKGDANKLKEITKTNRTLLEKLAMEVIYALGTNLVIYILGRVLNWVVTK